MKNTRDNTEEAGPSEQDTRPLFFTGIKKHYVRFRKIFINLLVKEDFERLSQELSQHTSERIKSFFIEEGHSLLNYAILSSNIQSLNFIVEKIPPEAVKQLFNNDKMDFLEGFLYTQKMAEMRKENNPPARELVVQKFVLLLKIEPDGVQEFMNEYVSNRDYVTPAMAAAYQVALKIFQDSIQKQTPKC